MDLTIHVVSAMSALTINESTKVFSAQTLRDARGAGVLNVARCRAAIHKIHERRRYVSVSSEPRPKCGKLGRLPLQFLAPSLP